MPERAGIPEHLATCDTCREWLAELTKCEEESSGADTSSISDPLLNTIVGRYKLVAPLGSGAAGLVYKAYDPALDRFIAIKLLRTVEDEGLRKSLVREAQAMAQLSDPHIVSVFDVGEANGEVYIAMELVDAGTLTQWLAKQSRSWQQIVARFVDVGVGLQKIHEADFVHRDIKPDNILISIGGERALVGDLGLSGTTNGKAFAARVGTPAYMAPEVQAGKAATASSDQFSFCCSLFQSLSGQLWLPTSANHKESRDILQTLRVPQRITLAILRGLSADPAQRFPSMNHLLASLRPPAPRVSWKRRAAVALGLAFALYFLASYVWNRGAATDDCAEGTQRIDEVWSPATRTAAKEQFLRLDPLSGGSYFESFSSLLDQRMVSLQSDQTQTCRALEESASGILYEQAACLEDRLGEVRSLLSVLKSARDADLAQFLRLTETLTPISSCHGEHTLALPSPPVEIASKVSELRRELQMAEISLELGAVPLAKKLLSSVLSQTYEYDLHYPPFHAEHAYVEALLQLEIVDKKKAHGAFQKAAELADLAGHDIARANALTALVALSLGTYEESIVYGQRALAVLERINAPAVALASVESQMAEQHFRHGAIAQARSASNRALALLENAGPEYAGRVANVLDTLAVIEGDPEVALKTVQESLRLRRRVPGTHPDLPRTLAAYAEVLRSTGRANEAIVPLREALSAEQKSRGAKSFSIAVLLTALCITQTDIAAADLKNINSSQLEEAEATCQEALAIYENTEGKEDVQTRSAHSDSLAAYARTFLITEQYQEALGLFEQSRELSRGVEDDPITQAVTGVGIAMCLEALKQDLSRARELAEQALSLYAERLSPAENEQLAELLVRIQSL